MSNVLFFPSPVRPPVLRWKAEVVYRTDLGPLTLEHTFEEIEELAELIEDGPDWRCLIGCTVTLNRAEKEFAGLTLEKAAKL